MIRVLMFGRLQQAAGWRERAFDVASLDDLRGAIAAEDADLAGDLTRPGVFAAVNKTLVRGDHPLEPGDEVAFVPPVSGG